MIRRALAVLATALVVVTLQAGAASAEQTLVRDATRDMWRLSGSSPAATAAPHRRNGDLRRTSVRHGPHNVVLISQYRALFRTGRYHQITTRLSTRTHRYREVVIEASPRNRRGIVRVFNRSGSLLACRPSFRIDYRRDRVRLAVPRACFGRPSKTRAIRASTATYWADGDGVLLTDNPHNRRAHVTSWTRYLRSA